MVAKAPRRPTLGTDSESLMPPQSLLTSPEQVLAYYRRLGVQVDPSVDISAIIDANDEVTLAYKDLGINDAYIMRTEDDRFEIAVNNRHHPNRQRFSMAHEYGHYLLHRKRIQRLPVGEQILHRDASRNPVEYQANAFAADLLMPNYLVTKAYQTHAGRLKAMADALQVSQDALGYRLRTLGYDF